MKKLQGKGVVDGLVRGKVKYYQKKVDEISTHSVEDVDNAWELFIQGRDRTINALKKMREKLSAQASTEEEEILEAHMMMVEDVTFEELIKDKICNRKMNAAYAVSESSKELAAIFEGMDNQYMKERATDLKDVTTRIINHILHPDQEEDQGFNSDGEMIILAAKDLMPSETIQMDKSKILAILTEEGTANSHTVIIARSLNIPAIIAIGDGIEASLDGEDVIVDGKKGEVFIQPDEETIEAFKKLEALIQERLQENDTLIGQDNVTKKGSRIDIYANIGSADEVDAVLRYDAGGIGLFRSEFLFLEKSNYPTEEEQFEAYKKVALAMEGKRVIVRTIDIGADKQAGYFNIPKEENPAMGYRAIRICLEEPEIFKVQLRALYRASAFGKIAIMFPMITSLEEIVDIKAIITQVRLELDQAQVDYNKKLELGIMIETPAAVIISDELAKEVDFFSIGTNDLTQYTLAVDRQNPRLERFYHPHHKAVLRMIKQVVEAGHDQGIWVGICGELGGDIDLVDYFLSIGLDEISIAPAKILTMRAHIRSLNI